MASGFDFSAFIAGFQEEAEERLQSIESTLVDVEQGTLDADQLEKLRRDAHSVKGSANMLQLRDIGESAHVLEDTFAYLRDGEAVPSQGLMNFMFDLLDSLRSRIQEADDSGADQLDPEGFREQLENLDSAADEGTEAGEGMAAESEPELGPGPEAEEPEGLEISEEPALPGESNGLEESVATGVEPGGEEIPLAESDPASTEALQSVTGRGAEAAPNEDPEGGELALELDGEETAEAGRDTPSSEEGEPREASAESGVDLTRLIPGLREEVYPVLEKVQEGLSEADAAKLDSELLDELESAALSLRQVALEDAAEVIDVVANVLESPAATQLPNGLLEVLKGLLERVRRRLDEADQPGSTPLDRNRISQARQLLERWGMVARDHASSGKAEGPPPAEDAADEPAPPAEPDDEPPAIADPGQGAAHRSPRQPDADMDVSEFLDGFQAEARELLSVIQDGLLQAEHGELSQETLESMRQKAHGLKGSANMLGLADVGAGAEVLEDGLRSLAAESEQAPNFEVLLELHDALRDAAEQVREEDRPRVDPLHWRARLNEGPRSGQEGGGASASTGESQPVEASQPASQSPAKAQSEARPKAQPKAQPKGQSGQAGGQDDQSSAGQGGGGKTKNTGNRGTMRVSADRLERLSEGVIGLAMDRATQEDRRAELDQLVADFRALRQQWEWFEQILPDTGPLVEQKNQLTNHLDSLNQQMRQFRQETELDLASRHSMYDEIHQRVMDLMVTPLGNIFSVLPRSARDLAQRFQKRVELTIDGSEIELERRNVDALLEPLVHLVTNAISHGIEDAEERKAAGKDPVGHIRVQAQQVGGEVAISVSDDGRGIDYEKVRETAIRTGVTTAAEAENMLPYDLLQMLFRPGFSTKEEVSQISGRGIGMNAVRETVQRMTGSIQVDSEVGQGSTFTLNIPVSTAVQRVLKFQVGEETFGVLANQVDRIMTLQDTVLTETGGQRFFQYQGNQVPATWLQDLFNLPEQEVQEAGSLQVVVVRHLEGYIGFLVNEVLEETQAVVKDVTGYLRRHAIQGLIGTTISGAGEVQLLLEPTGIKEMERTSPLTLKAGEVLTHDPLKGLRVLLVEDSPLARQMEKAVLENSGMEVDTAVDGLDALDRMEVLFPDIVISDVEMPRMDGYDLLRKLRDDDRYRGVPVFMVTSRDSEEDRNTAQQLGADGFLNKLDLQSGDLIEEIRGRLERLYA